MQAARAQFAVKLLPSLTDFAFLMPLAFLFGRMNGAKTLLGDCDTGWHIRTGEWILANRQAPIRDMFSFSKPGDPWFAWEWLSDIVFARLNAFGGLEAVVLFSILLIAATFTGLYLLVRSKSNPVIAILVTMVAGAASSIHWLARPHLFTLLFLVVFYALLERVSEGRTRIAGVPVLALLPAISVLWTNLHGGFFVGAMLVAAYGAGEWMRILLLPAGAHPAARRSVANRYLLTAGACMAVSLINPYTYHLHLHMAQYLRDPFNSQYIVEFLSPNFHHPTAIFFEAMLVLAMAASVSNLRQGRFTEVLLMVVWAHGALLATRNIPIFMILSAPPVAQAAQRWLRELPRLHVAAWLRSAAGRFNRIASETAATDAMPRFHLVSIAASVLVAALVCAPNPPKKFRAEFDPEVYPAKAVATLRGDTSARIFANDEWGDYLIYSLYPKHRVFVDGRSDFYGNAFEEKYIDVLNVKFGWEQTLSRFRIDTILLSPSAPLAGALKESNKWRVAYDDGVALIFRAVARPRSEPVSVTASLQGGEGRDREVTKTTTASDRAITKTKQQLKPKT
jgi:hypothetical protein